MEWLTYLSTYRNEFFQGTILTLKLVGLGLVAGFGLGLLAALMRVYGGKLLRWVAIGYIELFRGTPLLVQLFLVYFGLPDMGITLDRMTAAYITLALNSGAYQAEYLRGAIQSIGSGQMMAARAIGMSRMQAIQHIILPQALRIVIPAWSNEPISLIKASAVAYLIAVPDLMNQAKIIVGKLYDPIGVYSAVALVYLAIVFLLTWLLGRLERRVAIPGMEMEAQRTR
jgi:polar amino acid transport system permease protein